MVEKATEDGEERRGERERLERRWNVKKNHTRLLHLQSFGIKSVQQSSEVTEGIVCMMIFGFWNRIGS